MDGFKYRDDVLRRYIVVQFEMAEDGKGHKKKKKKKRDNWEPFLGQILGVSLNYKEDDQLEMLHRVVFAEDSSDLWLDLEELEADQRLTWVPKHTQKKSVSGPRINSGTIESQGQHINDPTAASTSIENKEPEANSSKKRKRIGINRYRHVEEEESSSEAEPEPEPELERARTWVRRGRQTRQSQLSAARKNIKKRRKTGGNRSSPHFEETSSSEHDDESASLGDEPGTGGVKIKAEEDIDDAHDEADNSFAAGFKIPKRRSESQVYEEDVGSQPAAQRAEWLS